MPILDPSKRERRGLIMLLMALLLFWLVGIVMLYPDQNGEQQVGEDATKELTYHAQTQDTTKNRYYAVPENRVETFPFDPNTADSTTLLRLGFQPFMVRNIYKYRARGGRYHTPEEVSRVYGMTHELWDRIYPYIQIAEKYKYMEPVKSSERGDFNRLDSVLVPRSNNMSPGEKIAINGSDTLQLQRIPGIGPYYARVIAKYRDQLGGFVSLSQLDEIDELPEDFSPWFYLDDVDIRQIDVNKATQRELVRHPYLRVRLALPIIDHRRKYGTFRNLQELRRLPNFTDKDIERLEPYIKF